MGCDTMAVTGARLYGRCGETFPGASRGGHVQQGLILAGLCVWNPRVFADDARGWQCPFEAARAPSEGSFDLAGEGSRSPRSKRQGVEESWKGWLAGWSCARPEEGAVGRG